MAVLDRADIALLSGLVDLFIVAPSTSSVLPDSITFLTSNNAQTKVETVPKKWRVIDVTAHWILDLLSIVPTVPEAERGQTKLVVSS